MASKGAIAVRASTARDRIQAAMGRLSKQAGVPLPAPVGYPYRQTDLRAAAELERVAAFLDAVAPPASQDTPQGTDGGEANGNIVPIRRRQADDNALSQAVAYAEADAAKQDEPEGEAGDDLDSLTVVELKDRAKAVHVKGYGSMTKAELVDALRGQG